MDGKTAYLNRARTALLRHLLKNGTGTSDVPNSTVKTPPGIDRRCLGNGVTIPLLEAGIIQRGEWTESVRESHHAAPRRLWKITNRKLAEQWLAENADREPPEQPTLFDFGLGI